ncbi:MAG: PQQ-binding-like beta-propeller repeat protein [Candidatus Hydrogenedentes bacterium]|nr:PQQ-binding-like beta-propeller repeat protein [Candidatus Hydrogenedentota bacterium]
MRRYVGIWMTGAVAAVALGGCEEIPCPEAIPGRVESEITATFDARAWDICAASGGGFVVAGYASGQPFSPVASATYERSLDSFVVMLDASGNIEWSRTFGGDGADEVRNIEPAGDGGYIVAGNKGASPLDPVFFYDPASVFAARLDSQGSVLWTVEPETDRFTAAYGLCVNADGSFVVAGDTRDAEYGASDAFLIKFDPNGAELWRRRYGSGRDVGAQDVITTSDGGYAFTGYVQDQIVARLDAGGEVQWEFFLDEVAILKELAFRTKKIIETSDGGFAVVGSTFGELLVLKLDGGGNYLWQARVSDVGEAEGHAILETAEGDLVAAGVSYARNSFGRRVCSHLLLVRLGSEGDIRWSGQVGSKETIFPCAMVVDGDSLKLAGSIREDFVHSIYLVTTDAGG